MKRKDQIYKRFLSFRYAFKGLKHMLRFQPNFIIHLTVALAVIILGMYVQLSSLKWVGLLLVIGLVLVMEILNTVVEYLVDFVCKERNPVAGRIKDLSASAVLVAAFTAVAVGLVIFVPELF